MWRTPLTAWPDTVRHLPRLPSPRGSAAPRIPGARAPPALPPHRRTGAALPAPARQSSGARHRVQQAIITPVPRGRSAALRAQPAGGPHDPLALGPALRSRTGGRPRRPLTSTHQRVDETAAIDESGQPDVVPDGDGYGRGRRRVIGGWLRVRLERSSTDLPATATAAPVEDLPPMLAPTAPS